MAYYPHAVLKLLPENNSQGRINPTQIILHTAVDAPGPTSLYGYFARGDVGVESHFFIRLDGSIEQYMDTERRADANRYANVRAISIETEDDGDIRPWTDAQLHAIRALGDWLMAVHGIPRQVCAGWDQPGWGYHAMWGAPSPWTPSRGKTCPGSARIYQFDHVLVPWLYAPPPAPAPPTSVPEDDQMMLVESQVNRGIWLLHGDTFMWLSSTETVQQLLDKGVPATKWHDHDFMRLVQAKGQEEAAQERADMRLADIQKTLGEIKEANQ